MLVTSNIRNIYEKIQKQLFYMIPEKWDRVYLYASVLDHYNNVQTGEMFFYYYPKSVLKKNPVNVYEIPNKFNIDEQAYLKLAENLYEEIKKLRIGLIKIGEKPWTNITISIKDFKFNVEYDYEDLVNSNYTSYDRHLIWRYKYLEVPISSYSRKDRKMLEKYLTEEKYHNKNINTYSEGIYKKPISNILAYGKSEEQNYYESSERQEEVFSQKEENAVYERKQVKTLEEASNQDRQIKSQILKFN
ncbi:MAG: antitoxin YezG family protein [Clostridia bacterium]|nr:antitoxin YezG family protein [Clostridia bacterium]